MLPENLFESVFQRGQFQRHRLPNDGRIYVKISVNQPVPHGDDVAPWNLRKRLAGRVRDLACGLTEDLDAFDERE